MATGSSSKAAGASGTPRPASGHAARTKVTLPGDATPGTASDAPGPKPRPKRRPPAPPKPWYRKGRFWLAVIVVEAVAALVLSIVFMPKSDEVALGGADFTQFCPIITQGQALNTATSPKDAAQVAQVWGARADLLRRLQPVAPDDLRPDLIELVALAQGVQDEANAVQSRRASDPAYDGTVAIETREGQVGSEGELAMQRLNLVVRQGCGVDLTAATPSTTAAPTTPSSSPAPTNAVPPTTGPGPVVVGPTMPS